MDLIEHTYTIQWVGPMDYEEYREYLRNQESLHPKERMEKEDWDELEETVGELIPYFSQILKNQLTIKEYRICLLIRLKFSPTIIGNIVGLSNSGVSLSRKRMLEKVCGKDGTPKDFDKFILSLV